MNLLLDDLQDLHGAGLDADATGDALGSGAILIGDDQVEGAGLSALAAAGAELLVDHVHAGLGILGDRTGGTDLGHRPHWVQTMGLAAPLRSTTWMQDLVMSLTL